MKNDFMLRENGLVGVTYTVTFFEMRYSESYPGPMEQLVFGYAEDVFGPMVLYFLARMVYSSLGSAMALVRSVKRLRMR